MMIADKMTKNKEAQKRGTGGKIKCKETPTTILHKNTQTKYTEKGRMMRDR